MRRMGRAKVRGLMSDSSLLISYAQNGEDIVLARGLHHRDGFYVDIGAFDPYRDSVTKLFHDRGWRGINVDPIPEVIALFERDRPGDINIQAAISAEPGTADLWTGPTNLVGHSTLDKRVAQAHLADGIEFTRSSVKTIRLDALLEATVPSGTNVDFLKIDVEGYEEFVLESCDWSKWHPRVVVVECIVPYGGGSTHQKWEHLLLESGYKMCLFDGLNRFYVDSSDSELAAAISSPASVIDNFERAAVHEMSVRFAELVHAEAERAQAEAHRAQAEADQAQAEINVGLLRTRVEELSRKLAENIERQRTLTMEIDRRDVLLEDSSIRVETLDQEISLARNHELALEAALTAIEQTKVFRYSRGLRHVYGLFLRR